MRTKRPSILLILFSLVCALTAWAQAPSAKGSLEVSGRVRIEGKAEKLTRKRFYLFAGSLKENAGVIERIKSAEITSRDCYYTQAKASQPFICWLRAADCESPYCRTATESEIQTVPEFKAAYIKGMTLFRGKAPIAGSWLLTNMPQNLVNGFYLQKRTLTDKLLADIKPLQSSMTDTVTVKSIFIDMPLASGAMKFTVSNILPMEIGRKSYVWTCEVSVEPGKTAKLNLQVPEPNKPVKNCEVVIKDLVECGTGACEQK